jgi:hypothetical protein
VFIVFEEIVLMDSDHYRCIFRLTTIVFFRNYQNIGAVLVSNNIVSISFWRKKKVKIKVIWPPIDRFGSFSSLEVMVYHVHIEFIMDSISAISNTT